MTEFEEELTRQLCPVRAPDALWERIHEQRRPLRVSRTLGPGTLLGTIALVIVTAGFAMRFVPAPARSQANIEIGIANILQSTSCASGSPSLLNARLIRWNGRPFVSQTSVQAACVQCHS